MSKDKDTISFLICFSMGEIVTWGDEYDDDDFYANHYLQLMVNHLQVPFPICYLYFAYFNLDSHHCHVFESPVLGNDNLLVLDLRIHDKTDQHDLVYLGVKCHKKFADRVRYCLKNFIYNMELNSVINPYKEDNQLDSLEELIKEHYQSK